MFLLLAQNPVHPMDVVKPVKVQQFGRYFTPLFKIVTDENTVTVPTSAVRARVVDGKQKKYIFFTDIQNLISEGRKTFPKRLIAKLNGVKRIWRLDRADSRDRVIYKSIVGDTMVLTQE